MLQLLKANGWFTKPSLKKTQVLEWSLFLLNLLYVRLTSLYTVLQKLFPIRGKMVSVRKGEFPGTVLKLQVCVSGMMLRNMATVFEVAAHEIFLNDL